MSTPQSDRVDDRVLAELERDHPGLRLPPVVLVIAAYNEAAGLPRVLASLPDEVCGLPAAARPVVPLPVRCRP